MRRIEAAVLGVIVAATGLSWTMSLAEDRDQLFAASRVAGQAWAQREGADPPRCRKESIRLTAPVDTAAWRAGCIDRAVVNG